jgi:hypothetical protein
MRGAIPPFPNTPSWRGAQLKHKVIIIIIIIIIIISFLLLCFSLLPFFLQSV